MSGPAPGGGQVRGAESEEQDLGAAGEMGGVEAADRGVPPAGGGRG